MDELKKNLFSRTYDLCDKLTDLIEADCCHGNDFREMHTAFRELHTLIENAKLEREYYEYIMECVYG